MHATKVVLIAGIILASPGLAHAGFFDVVRTVGNVADTVADTNRALAEGRLPNVAVKGGGKGGGKHAGGGGGRRRK